MEVSAFSECFLFLIFFFFCGFFMKGENFVAKGNLDTIAFLSWNQAHSSSVSLEVVKQAQRVFT